MVHIAPQLAAQLAPTDTVFVFARAAEGSRMPLAIVRAQARDLPLAFTLDDSAAMTPGVSLADKGPLVVVASISRSGNATAQAGDLQSQGVAVALGARDVRVVVSEAAK